MKYLYRLLFLSLLLEIHPAVAQQPEPSDPVFIHYREQVIELFSQGQQLQADTLFQKIIQEGESKNYPQWQSWAMRLRMNVWSNSCQLDSVFSRRGEYSEFMLRNGLMQDYIDAQEAVVISLLDSDMTTLAMRVIKEMYDDPRLCGEPLFQGVPSMLMGVAYMRERKSSQALSMIEEAGRLLPQDRFEKRLDLEVRRLDVLLSAKEYDKVVRTQTVSLKTVDEIEKEYPVAAVCNPIRYYLLLEAAEAYTSLGNLSRAYQAMEAADTISGGCVSFMHENYKAKVHSIYHLKMGEPDQALSCIAPAMQNIHYYMSVYSEDYSYFLKTKSSALTMKGEPAQAVALLDSVILIQDSLSRKRHSTQLAEFNIIYGLDKATAAKSLAQQRLRVSLIILLLIVVTLLIVIWYNRLLRRKNRTLCEQIERDAKSFEQLKTLQKREWLYVIPGELAQSEESEDSLFDRIERLFTFEYVANTSLSRERVASDLATNTTYLARAIRDGSGQSFGKYLATVRLRYAVTLMRERPQASLDEIASLIGYESYSGFFSAFKKQYEVSPSRYVEYLKRA